MIVMCPVVLMPLRCDCIFQLRQIFRF